MRKVLTVFGASLLGLLGVYAFLVTFSGSESRFECQGTVLEEGTESPKKAFIRISRYRWWVGLWSDSWGSAWIEIPNETIIYISHIEESGDLLGLWESDRTLRGNFSTLSRSLQLSIRNGQVFAGTCHEIER